MAGAGRTVVKKVTVKPELDKREAKKAELELQKQLGKVKVPLDIDTRNAAERIDKLTEKIEGISENPIELPVNTEQLDSAVSAVERMGNPMIYRQMQSGFKSLTSGSKDLQGTMLALTSTITGLSKNVDGLTVPFSNVKNSLTDSFATIKGIAGNAEMTGKGMKIAGAAAKGFAVSMASAMGVIGLAVAGISALATAIKSAREETAGIIADEQTRKATEGAEKLNETYTKRRVITQEQYDIAKKLIVDDKERYETAKKLLATSTNMSESTKKIIEAKQQEYETAKKTVELYGDQRSNLYALEGVSHKINAETEKMVRNNERLTESQTKARQADIERNNRRVEFLELQNKNLNLDEKTRKNNEREIGARNEIIKAYQTQVNLSGTVLKNTEKSTQKIADNTKQWASNIASVEERLRKIDFDIEIQGLNEFDKLEAQRRYELETVRIKLENEIANAAELLKQNKRNQKEYDEYVGKLRMEAGFLQQAIYDNEKKQFDELVSKERLQQMSANIEVISEHTNEMIQKGINYTREQIEQLFIDFSDTDWYIQNAAEYQKVIDKMMTDQAVYKQKQLEEINKRVADSFIDAEKNLALYQKGLLNMNATITGLQDFDYSSIFKNSAIKQRKNFDAEEAEIRRAYNRREIDYNEYEKQITAIQKKAQQEREENAHEHSQAIANLLKMNVDAFMSPIASMQAEGLQDFFKTNLASQQLLNKEKELQIKIENELSKVKKEQLQTELQQIQAAKDKLAEDQLHSTEILKQTSLYSAMGGTITGIADAFADGKVEGKEMFAAVLCGAMKALPALIATAGVSNPFAIAAIGVGVTTLLGVIKGAVQKFEGGGEIKGRYTGKDDTLILAQAGEYVVPRNIAQDNIHNLERLRQTGRWSNTEISMAGVERRLDEVITVLNKQKTTAVKLEHNVKMDKNKFLNGLALEQARQSF